MLFSRAEGGCISSGGRDELSITRAKRFLNGVVRRRLRKNVHVGAFFERLQKYDEAELTWNFVKRIHTRTDHWVSIHAWKKGESVVLHCLGPQADEAVENANNFGRRRRHRTSLRERVGWSKSERRRRRRNRRKNRAFLKLLRLRTDQLQSPKVHKKAKGFVKAPISLERNVPRTPQFRKNRIFWSEAVTASVAIFNVKPSEKRTAREVVARELWGSLERSGYRFAQFKRRGFSMRFDLIDGRWRGDITALTISCTKDNQHPTYRNMREHFKDLLLGHPVHEQRERRHALALVRFMPVLAVA